MATRDIRTRLALDGEAEFKAAMKGAYSEMKVLGSELKLSAAEFKNSGDAQEYMRSRSETLRKEIDQQKQIVTALESAVADATTKYGDGSPKVDEYRSKLNYAQTSLVNMERQLGNVEKGLDDNGKAIEGNKSKFDSFAEAAGKVTKILGDGLTVAAKTVAGAMAAVGTAAVAAGTAVFNLATDTGEYADTLLTTSAQTGISTEKLQEWEYAARFIDTEVETMTGSMAKMIRNMDSAAVGTGASAEAFAALGINVVGVDGQLRDSQEVFFQAIDALGQVANETERDSLAMQIFGKSAQDLNPLIIAGSDTLAEYGQEAHDLGLIMSDEMLSAFGSLDDQMQRFDASTTAAGNNLAAIFLPAINAAMDGANEMMTTINQTLSDGFQADDIKVIGETVAQELTDGLESIEQYMPSVLSTAADVISMIVDTMVNTLPRLLPSLMHAATSLLENVMDSIAKNISAISKAASEVIASFVRFLADNLPKLLDAGLKMVVEIAKGISQELPSMVKSAVGCVAEFVQAILSNLPELFSAGLDMIVSLAKGIIDAIPQLIDALPELISSFIEFIVSALPEIIVSGVEMIGALIEGLIKAIPTLIANIPRILSAIVDGFVAGLGALVDIGGYMVEGIWNGIKSMGNWLWNKLSGWANDIMGWFKNLFGIHSPSSVFRDQVGMQIGAGVAEGIYDSIGLVRNAMSDMESAISPRKPHSGSIRYGLTDSTVDQLASAVYRRFSVGKNGQTVVLQLNDRELGRAVRGYV